jgi:large subunit ribosomal protein L24
MKTMHIRKGDIVQVIAGKDMGKRGKVLKVDRSGRRLVVEGINRAKKHMRPSQANPQGGVVDWELPIDVSNVMLVCEGCDTPSRVRRLRTGGKSFVRVCKKCEREF